MLKTLNDNDTINNEVLLLNKDQNHNNVIDSNDTSNKSNWNLICNVLNCKQTFKKSFNGRKYNWIQLAGHVGKFKPGDRDGYILKLMDNSERNCLLDIKLNNDPLIEYVPRVSNDFVIEDNKKYTEMQDLLYGFEDACIMDIKIGTKTFDNKDDVNKLRDDLFKRLYEIDPNELTHEELELKAISKKRFMRWRETSTSSSTLGFRVEAIKIFNKPLETNYFKLKNINDIKNEFIKFTSNNSNAFKTYYKRLIALRETLEQSSFFKTHQMIGSSLLFVHDSKQSTVGMIDFGRASKLPNNIQINHDIDDTDNNYEDGYLIGIDSLIKIFKELMQEN